MVVDSSAIVALICGEPTARDLHAKLAFAETRILAAPTMFEAALVLSTRLSRDGMLAVREFLVEFNVRVIPFTEIHAAEAYTAHLKYGKGRHPAGLNLGDCHTYALAKSTGEPLLFVGNDFTKTDIVAA